ncbi:MAG: MGMT family protein [Chloroflexi bacterium]|nr:MGMT family protein [Chloroflexota bacterium]
MNQPTTNFYRQVYHVVQRIPAGKVSSYGRIAAMLGRSRAARAVGYALSNLKPADSSEPYTSLTVPWQRVINSQGRISIRHRQSTANKQARLLREEGVTVNDDLRIDLSIFLWEGLHLFEIDDILQQK